MSKIISVVPNISEGNDQPFISGLVEKLQAVKNLVVLDTSRDSVRNRTVFSFTGPQEAIFAAGLILYRETLAHVDMRKHHGEYPRLGAVDVFPFVPLKDATLEETVAMSVEFAEKVAAEFNIPVYLYCESARFPMRRYIENIREGEYEGLENKLKDPRWKPDFGPAVFNPAAGATVIGARYPMISFKAILDTPDEADRRDHQPAHPACHRRPGPRQRLRRPGQRAQGGPDHRDHRQLPGHAHVPGAGDDPFRGPALRRVGAQGGDDRPGPGDGLHRVGFLLPGHPGFLLRQDPGAQDPDRPRRAEPAGLTACLRRRRARCRRDRQMSEILRIFHAALAAVDPFRAGPRKPAPHGNSLAAGPHRFALDEFASILVVGAGKAAAGMGLAVEAVLGDRISAGLLVLPEGSRAPFKILAQAHAGASRPRRSRGEGAAARILAMLHKPDEKSLVLCLISGGASSLLALPGAGGDPGRQEGCHRAAARSRRRHRRAERRAQAPLRRQGRAGWPPPLSRPPVLTLALSDVSGDPPDVIGSGPTVADDTTFADAWAVIEKYGLQDRIPVRVQQFLERGLAGREERNAEAKRSPPGASAFVVIGNNARALAGARAKANAMGWRVEVSAAPVQGEARIAARALAAAALKAQAGLQPGEKLCLISGGETTVSVPGSGRGGRNQELALAFALEIAGKDGIEMLSAGSDGVDGPTDAAGAVVDGATVERAADAWPRRRGLS